MNNIFGKYVILAYHFMHASILHKMWLKMRITSFMHAYAIYACLSFENIFLDVVQFVFGSRFFLASKMLDVQNSFFGRPIFLDVQKK